MSVESTRSSWLGDGVTSLTKRESGKNTCIGLTWSELSNGPDLNASLSLTVVNCLDLLRACLARESCGDAHIGPMVFEVNRSFLTGSAVSVGSVCAVRAAQWDRRPVGWPKSPAIADDMMHRPCFLPTRHRSRVGRSHVARPSPLPARGERSEFARSSRKFRVRGRLRESERVETPPHPDPLPASGEREQRRRANAIALPTSGEGREGVSFNLR